MSVLIFLSSLIINKISDGDLTVDFRIMTFTHSVEPFDNDTLISTKHHTSAGGDFPYTV